MNFINKKIILLITLTILIFLTYIQNLYDENTNIQEKPSHLTKTSNNNYLIREAVALNDNDIINKINNNNIWLKLSFIFNVNNEIKVIGTRHGEKLYESLLSKEEAVKSIDMGNYFRVPADTRDLNYSKFFNEGNSSIELYDEYNSHNTVRLNKNELKNLLLNLSYVKNELNK